MVVSVPTVLTVGTESILANESAVLFRCLDSEQRQTVDRLLAPPPFFPPLANHESADKYLCFACGGAITEIGTSAARDYLHGLAGSLGLSSAYV